MKSFPAHPLGDAAFTLTLGDDPGPALLKKVHAAAAHARAAALEHVYDVIPGHTTITIFFDPARTSFAKISPRIIQLLDEQRTAPSEPAESHVIAVRYDGPDLGRVAAETGLSIAEVIRFHSGRAYTVEVLGFAPGFAYLGQLDERLALPRRAQPRLRVPAGSVAIAGRQTAVYPLSTPGGWHLIGDTDNVMFDPTRERPALLSPGDTVRFEPVQ